MKKYLTTIFLIYAVQLLQAQQFYNPFVSRFTYQYLNLGKDTASSLRSINTSKVDDDSVLTFNATFINYRSQENIFGKNMIYKPDGDIIFVINSKDTVLLEMRTVIGQEWLLCKSPRTIAKNMGKSLESFLGVSDSILTIKTDKGFEIKISKNYGMIKTIDMRKYVTNKYIKSLIIDAIPEVRLGTFANDPLVLFDYKIGELFFWKEVYINGWLILARTTYKRYKLINSVISTNLDTVTYKFAVDSRIYSRKYTNTRDNIYTEKDDYQCGKVFEEKYFRKKDNMLKYTWLSNEEGNGGVNEVILYDSILKRYTLKISGFY